MSFNTVTKKFVLEFPGDFEPKVSIGTRVEIGTPLGVGQKYRVLQEIPLQAVDEILVDDGVYVTKGEQLASSNSILKKSVWLADIEGLIRITKNSVQIVDVQDSYKYTSFVKGRVSYSGPDRVVIDALFYKFWLFASQGRLVKGPFIFIDNVKGIITSKDISGDVNGKILFINGFLTRAIVIKAINSGAVGIFGVSIDYEEYKRLGQLLKYINLGVLCGFGQFAHTNMLAQILRTYNRYYIEVDFSQEFFYVPVKSLFGIKHNLYLYSGTKWGVPVKVDFDKSSDKSNKLYNEIIVKIDKPSGDKVLAVDPSELFET